MAKNSQTISRFQVLVGCLGLSVERACVATRCSSPTRDVNARGDGAGVAAMVVRPRRCVPASRTGAGPPRPGAVPPLSEGSCGKRPRRAIEEHACRACICQTAGSPQFARRWGLDVPRPAAALPPVRCLFLSFFFFLLAHAGDRVGRRRCGGRVRGCHSCSCPRRVPGRRLQGAAATGGGRRRASLTAPGGLSVGVVTVGDCGGGGVPPFVPRPHASRVCPAPHSTFPAAGRCRALGPPHRRVVVAAIGGGACGRERCCCWHSCRCWTVVR